MHDALGRKVRRLWRDGSLDKAGGIRKGRLWKEEGFKVLRDRVDQA